jgi:hypothetical protein
MSAARRFLHAFFLAVFAFGSAIGPLPAHAVLRAQSVNQGAVAITGGSITGQSGTAYLLAQSYAAIAAPADTNENILVTVTIPANALGANGAIRYTANWSHTNNANNKSLIVRYSGAAGTLYVNRNNASLDNFRVTGHIGNRNATNSQFGDAVGFTSAGGLAMPGSNVTSAVDTTAATTLIIAVQKATAGDTVTLNSYTVELIKP